MLRCTVVVGGGGGGGCGDRFVKVDPRALQIAEAVTTRRTGGEHVSIRRESFVGNRVSIPGRLGEVVQGFGGGWRGRSGGQRLGGSRPRQQRRRFAKIVADFGS